MLGRDLRVRGARYAMLRKRIGVTATQTKAGDGAQGELRSSPPARGTCVVSA